MNASHNKVKAHSLIPTVPYSRNAAIDVERGSIACIAELVSTEIVSNKTYCMSSHIRSIQMEREINILVCLDVVQQQLCKDAASGERASVCHQRGLCHYIMNQSL